MPTFLRASLAAALPFALLMAGAANAHRDEGQYWVSQGISFALDKTTSIGLDASERYSDAAVSKNQYLVRATLLHQVAKGVELGGGFTWSQAGHINEYRPFQEITLTHGLLALRSRMEERMFDNADGTVWRWREKLTLVAPIDKARTWSIVANGEAMFHLNRTNMSRQVGFAQFRTLVGLRHSLNDHITLALSYQRQQSIVTGGDDVVVHQPILSLTSRF
jgi:hypothetical protein